MSKSYIQNDWEDIIQEISKNSNSIAYGIFSSLGKLNFANYTMCKYLDTTSEELSPKNKLVNPNFEKITSLKSNTQPIFRGILTIGNSRDINYVLNAKIFFRNNTYLIFAEPDILNLFEENSKMSRLNQEVNNLQRQLIKEKRTLGSTLNQLKETQQMLIHSEKMNALGQMIAGVAHEINNPISFVTNNLFILEKYTTEFTESYNELEIEIKKNASKELINIVHEIREKNEIDYLTEDIKDLLTESKSGVERVKVIINDLRNFSRLDEAEIKKIDLIENTRSTLTIVQSELTNKNIQFTFSAPDKLFVDCFPGQLNQAIVNILVNAIQAVKDNGKICLTIENGKSNFSISVNDNGNGIKHDNLTKIFDPFFTTKPVGKGTGLGLSITYKIIHDLHKGKIEIESQVGMGTEIKFIIPNEVSI